MTWIIMCVAMTAAAVGQAACPPVAWLGGVKPPLLLCVALYYALTRGSSAMLVAAFLAGLVQDALSPVPLGYSSFTFCLVCWAAGRVRGLVLTESIVTQLVFGAASAALTTLAAAGLLAQADCLVCPAWRLLLRTVASAALAVPAAPLVFAVVGALDRLVGNVMVKDPIDGFA
jgi:rod shape-determining protein MreD